MHCLPLALGLVLATQLPSEWIATFLDGSRALERGEIEHAIAAFERVQALLPGHAPSAFQLACAHARAGEIDAAFVQLERARDAGGLDAGQLEWEPWLATLREDGRFEELVAQARARESDDRAPSWELTTGLDAEGLSVDDFGLSGLTRGGTLIDLASGEVVAQLAAPKERGWTAAVDPSARFVILIGERELPGNRLGEWFLRTHDPASGDLLSELTDIPEFSVIQLDAKGERLLVAGGVPKRLRVLGTTGWTEFAAPPAGSTKARLSPDGTRLLLVFSDGMERSDVSFWDVDSGRCIARHDDIAGPPSSSMGFDAGSEVAFVVDQRASRTHLFDARTGTHRVELRSAGPALSAFAFRGAREVAVFEGSEQFGDDGRLAVFDARTGARARAFELPESHLTFECACSDGSHLWMLDLFGSLVLVDVRTGRIEWRDRDARLHGASFVRLGRGERELLCVRDGVLERRDAWTGAQLAPAASPQLATTLTVARTQPTAWIGGSDGSMSELELATGRTRRVLRGSGAAIVSIDLDAEDVLVAFTDMRGRMRAIDVHSGEIVAEYDDPVSAAERWGDPQVHLAPHGARALVMRPDSSRTLVDLASGRPLASISKIKHEDLRSCWTSEGERFAIGGEEADLVRSYSASDGAPTGLEMRVDGRVETLAFEPSGERLWVGTNRSRVHVFELPSGNEVRRLDLSDLGTFGTVELGSIAFSPDGRTGITASASYGIVAAWDARDGARLWQYMDVDANPAPLRALFGPSSEHVYVSGQSDATARVFDARTGETVLDLAGRGIEWLHPVVDEQIVLARTSDGLEALDAATGRVLWSRTEFAHEGWLLSAEGGHVDGTIDALASSHLFTGERSYPLDALAVALLDPAKVRAGAAGVELAHAVLPPAPQLAWRERPPRIVELREQDGPVTLALEARASSGIVGFEQRVDGELSFVPGELGEDGSRVLELELHRPASDGARDYRWRALDANGLVSHALYLRVEGS